MTSSAIFWPVLVQFWLTFAVYVLTFQIRRALVQEGKAKTSDFRTYEDEVPESRKWSRAISNQFESPVIFYALCIMAYVTATADTVMLVLAWSYTIAKTVHVYLHVTGNRLKYRAPMFGLSFLALGLMTVWFGVSLAQL